MRIDRRELKRSAREAMRAASPNAIFMTVAYLLLTTGLNWVVGRFAADPLGDMLNLYEQGVALDRAIGLTLRMVGRLGMFLPLLMMIWSAVADFSYDRWCLRTVQGERGELGDLIAGFSMVGRILWLRILTVVYALLWYLVVFMPMVIVIAFGMWLPLVGIPICIGVFLLGLGLWFSRVLRYAMAEFCLIDEPEMGASWALHRSVQMMRGRRMQYVLLVLSFVGWLLLGTLIATAVEGALVIAIGGLRVLTDPQAALSVGSGPLVVLLPSLASIPLYVWLKPYVTMTQCNFYERIKNGEEHTAA